MYVRKVAGRETTLGVSGALWRDALVMYDRETGSYWSQIDGQSIMGDAEGASLEEIPSVVTTWSDWRQMHPRTLVLRPESSSREGSAYEGYFGDSERMGIFGTENPDDRLPGKRLVLGLSLGDANSAVPISLLQKRSLLHDELGGTPILVVPSGPESGFAWVRRAGERTLTFKRSEQNDLHDVETGSLWDLQRGVAVEGPLAGTALLPVGSRRTYWFVWAAFHPETELIAEED